MDDIFKFWSALPGDACTHRDDREVLKRTSHHFELDCLAGPFMGRLLTAPVVLLFLSPGYDKDDKDHAESEAAQAYYARQRKGDSDLPSEKEHPAARGWITKKIKQFDLSYESIVSDVAILNIGPYKSKKFHQKDRPLLAALPSCRTTLGWAQSFLFPKAVEGEKVVVCMRSHRYWGLEPGERYGMLFAPKCNPNGIMYHKEKRDWELRDEVKKAVKNLLAH